MKPARLNKKNIANRKDLLLELVKTDFRLRYQNSVLGFIWVLLKPFLFFVVLMVVFSNFVRADIDNYALYLLLGLIMYSFFQEGTSQGMNALLGKAHIILKVNFPRYIAVISSTINSVITLILNLVVFTGFAVFTGLRVDPLKILMFLLVCVVLYVFILGISFVSSVLLVKFRDLQNIWDIFMQILFYATPIIIPLEMFPDKYQPLVKLNPLTYFIHSPRELLINSAWPEPGITLLYIVGVIVLLFIGLAFFNLSIKGIAEEF